MNKSNLKSYAPRARKDFIAAVTARAHLLGLDQKAGQLEVAPSQTQGDVTIIGGQAWPASVGAQREQLIARMQREGFAQTLEAVAYTWFNRFAALRYMELHDYLGHGHRALSSREGGLPEILAHAADLAQSGAEGGLPGLKPAQVTEMKLAGNRDGELYRLLLIAQCNALHSAMPFLFERIDDETELLLPDNLLLSDSVVAKLVSEIPEEDWAEVEIIGWLYQFYISEKKDQVIGKVVKSEDIPAATQLFTPNWIVQYLVQNSVGRLWLMANPQSTLAKEWPYYITPAEQTPEVQAQLDALIHTRVREDGDTLNPESITVLDPACGSGHILVVAYDVLKAIYLERGYRVRDIPRLILEKNLFGLDIDDRAAQMAGFALLMKARADDRRLFTATDDAGKLQPPKLNVLSLQESKGLSVDELATHLAPFKVQRATIAELVETFEHAKTFGSLIQIPVAVKTHLAVLPQVLALVKQSGDMYASAAADDLLQLVWQAKVLAMQFDAVVANPPYMGTKWMNDGFRKFALQKFPKAKSDVFAMFISTGFTFCKASGFNAMIAMQNWMFLSSYEDFRLNFLSRGSIINLIHLGARAFSEISGEVVQAAAFVSQNGGLNAIRPTFFRLTDGDSESKRNALLARSNCFAGMTQGDFGDISGGPIAYWVTPELRRAFLENINVKDVGSPKQGMATGDNGTFLRYWYEVDIKSIDFVASSSEVLWKGGKRYARYNKGGSFRKWYGNTDLVIKFSEYDYRILKSQGNHCPSENYYFRESLTWSVIATKAFGARYSPPGAVFDVQGSSAFPSSEYRNLLLGILSSNVVNYFMAILNPSVTFQVGDISKIPLPSVAPDVTDNVEKLISAAYADWSENETSFEFVNFEIIRNHDSNETLKKCWEHDLARVESRFEQVRNLEQDNNKKFIDAYGLSGELSPEVPDDQITLDRADREKDSQRLISYAIGCMMGRYSLDEPSLIYAHAGNVGFDPSRYIKFPADADGIVPITDELWFADDACSRIREFLRPVWGPDTLEENMAWLAESLGTKASETPDEAIRRYIADKFFKDHLQTYKKRPIYWLFSSGRQGAFQALVYLHRYNEGTLARLRAEYVVPLTGKIQSRIESLQKDIDSASSTAARNKLSKELEKLKRKHTELLTYDEKLRHYADMRIQLDLDDGVKVNYGRFGDLLDSVKVVTGGAGDE